MNKVYLTIFFLMLTINLMAQPTEGLIYASGSLTYVNPVNENFDASGNANGQKTATNNLMVAVQGGYFMSNNFVMGLTISYMNNQSSQENVPLTKTTSDSKTWYYGLFGRYYTKVVGGLYFTNSIAFSLRSGTNITNNYWYHPDSTTSSSLDVSGFTVSYAPGFSYFISPHFGMNLSIGSISYDHYRTTINTGAYSGTSSTNGNFNVILPITSFNIGVSFLIGKNNAAVKVN